MTITEAQEAKFDRICRKLRLQPGEHLLDIGCGWGGLIRWAVEHYGVTAHGITLSQSQHDYCQGLIDQHGLQDRMTVALCDYRDLPRTQTYDKIASVGMIEHVGEDKLDEYFEIALSVLKPGGTFLCHGIATRTYFTEDHGIGRRFLLRYIFPDTATPPVSAYLTSAERRGWEVVDVDNWRQHYALTTRIWAERIAAQAEAIDAIMDDRVRFLWYLYTIGVSESFAENELQIYQMLLRRAVDVKWNLPLTRQGWLC